MFELNQEELEYLKAIRDLNDGMGGRKTDYYMVVEAVHGDTGKAIPLVARLDEDGYITSNGLIKRYCNITEKGRITLTEHDL